MTTVAALLHALLSGGVILFQVALALGAPWGAYAMGGRFPGRFPPRLRAAAVAQAVLLGVMAMIVLARAGVVEAGMLGAAGWQMWGVVAFAGIAVVLNAVTPSALERRIWLPVALGLLVSSLMVAVRTP